MLKKPRFNRARRFKKTKCPFCEEKKNVDYKDIEMLKKLISERGKILSRDRTGVCPKHQRVLSKAIKRARFLALLPFMNRI